MVRRGDSYYGLLQAFADALKLLLKQYVAPTQSNIIDCLRLPNSGNALKLLVPNDRLKAMRE